LHQTNTAATWRGGDTGGLESLEQRGESAHGTVRCIARGTVAGIEQRDAANQIVHRIDPLRALRARPV
jgi:hypothetical protein